MKKNLFFLIAMAATALLPASCTKESKNPGNNDKPGVVRFTAQAAQVKTTIENGTGSERIVKWAAGDEIDIFWADGSTTATAESAGVETTFAAVGTVPETTCYAVYPSGKASFSDNTLSVTVPAIQDGTFASANMALARTTDYAGRTLNFGNLCALVKFSVADASYTKAVFKGAKGETVAGTATVDFSTSPVTLSPVAPATQVEITLSGAGEYYFAVIPTTFPAGYSITLYRGDVADAPATVRNEKVLERAHVYNMEGLDGKGVRDYFATPSGAGKKTGKNWEHAFGAAQLKAFIEQPTDGGVQIDAEAFYKAEVLDGATIHMAAGDYYIAGAAGTHVKVEFNNYGKQVAITFKGGYPTGLTGTTLTGRTTPAGTEAEPANCTAFTGNDEAGIFIFGNQTDVTFEGITFKNTTLSENGGAVRGEAGSSGDCTLTITSCRFVDNDNTPNDKTGAAISLGKSVVTVDACYFGGNKARNASCFQLNSFDGAVAISNCTFKNNSTTNTSGTIQNSGRTDVTITGCTFTSNSATNWGGVFHTNTSGANTVFAGCTFDQNAAKYGGVVNVGNGTATFNNCTFSGNTASFVDTATDANPEGGHAGGVAHMNDSNAVLTFDHCTFTGNSATAGSGGVIGMKTAKKLTIRNGCTITGGSAKYNGGVISFSSGDIVLSESAFSSNHADRDGGVVYIASGDAKKLDVTRCSFDGNYASCGSDDWGGGVMCAKQSANSSDATFTDCVFTGNHSEKHGGVITLQAYTHLKMDNCLIKGNYSGSRGMIRVNNNGLVYLNAVTFKGNYTEESNNPWGICLHGGGASVVCANNVTAVDNTSSPGSGKSSVTFNSDGSWLVTNSTIIDAAPTAVLRANNAASKMALCNNVIINTTDASKVFVLHGSGSFASSGHSVLSCPSAPASPVSLDASDKLGVSSLGGAAYFEDIATEGYLNKAGYSWNGVLTGYTPAVQDNVTALMQNNFAVTTTARSSITDIGKDFYSWLNGIGALGKDGRGVARTGTWWPGAYQNN